MDNHPPHPEGVDSPAGRELPTLETDAFRVQNAMRFTLQLGPSAALF